MSNTPSDSDGTPSVRSRRMSSDSEYMGSGRDYGEIGTGDANLDSSGVFPEVESALHDEILSLRTVLEQRDENLKIAAELGQSLMQQLDERKTLVAQLRNDLSDKDAEIDGMKEAQALLDFRLQALRNTNQQLTHEIGDLETERKAALDQLEPLTEKVKQLERDCHQAQTACKDYQDDMAALQMKHAKLDKANDNLIKVNDHLESELRQLSALSEESGIAAKGGLTHANQQISRLKEQCLQLQTENEKLQLDVVSLVELKERNAELQHAAEEDKILYNEARAQIAALTQRLQNLQMETGASGTGPGAGVKTSLMSDIEDTLADQLASSLQANGEGDEQVHSKVQGAASDFLSDALARAKSRKAEALGTAKEIQDRDWQSLTSQIEALTAQLAATKSAHETQIRETEKMHTESLQQEKEYQQSLVKSAQEDRDMHAKAAESVKAQLVAERKERTELQLLVEQGLSRAHTQYSEMEDELSRAGVEIQQRTETVDQQAQELEELRHKASHGDAAQSKLSELHEYNEALAAQLNQVTEQSSSDAAFLASRICRLEEALSETKSERKKLTAQLETERSERQTLLDDMAKSVEDAGGQTTTLRAELESLANSKASVEAELTQAKESLQQKSDEVSSLSAKVKDITNEANTAKEQVTQLQSEKKDALSQVTSLTNQVTTATTQATSDSSTITDLESKCAKASKEVGKLTEEVESLTTANTSLQKNFDEVMGKLADLEELMKEKEQHEAAAASDPNEIHTVEQAKAEIESLHHIISNLDSKLVEAFTSSARQNKLLSRLKDENAQYKDLQTQSFRQIAELHTKLTEARKRQRTLAPAGVDLAGSGSGNEGSLAGSGTSIVGDASPLQDTVKILEHQLNLSAKLEEIQATSHAEEDTGDVNTSRAKSPASPVVIGKRPGSNTAPASTAPDDTAARLETISQLPKTPVKPDSQKSRTPGLPDGLTAPTTPVTPQQSQQRRSSVSSTPGTGTPSGDGRLNRRRASILADRERRRSGPRGDRGPGTPSPEPKLVGAGPTREIAAQLSHARATLERRQSSTALGMVSITQEQYTSLLSATTSVNEERDSITKVIMDLRGHLLRSSFRYKAKSKASAGLELKQILKDSNKTLDKLISRWEHDLENPTLTNLRQQIYYFALDNAQLKRQLNHYASGMFDGTLKKAKRFEKDYATQQSSPTAKLSGWMGSIAGQVRAKLQRTNSNSSGSLANTAPTRSGTDSTGSNASSSKDK